MKHRHRMSTSFEALPTVRQDIDRCSTVWDPLLHMADKTILKRTKDINDIDRIINNARHLWDPLLHIAVQLINNASSLSKLQQTINRPLKSAEAEHKIPTSCSSGPECGQASPTCYPLVI